MPGLVVTTGVRVGTAGTADVPTSALFIAGTAQRGPSDDYRLVRSFTEFADIYGDYVSDGTLFQHLQCFFEEGGTRAYVIRVVAAGASGTGGELATTLDFGTTSNGGTLCFSVDPVGAGDWAEDLDIAVTDGVISGTKRVTVTYDDEIIYVSGDLATNRAISEALNANAGNYVTATYNTANATLPANRTQTFSGGQTGNAVIEDDELVDALDVFVPELGAGVVAIPEFNGIAIWDGIQNHCLDNNRIGFCGFPYDDAVDGVGNVSGSLDAAMADLTPAVGSGAGQRLDGPYYGTTDAQKTDASVLAFFWPHVVVPNGSGGTNTISPESFAAAARARAHAQVGPWRPGAGLISASRFATSLAFPVNSVYGEQANDARINALRIIDNTVRVYGARSVSADEINWRYITFRDVVNYVAVQAGIRLEPYVFSAIDSRNTIFGQIAAEMVNLLEPLRIAGGIYEGRDARGNIVDRGYTVEVSDALNPTQQLAAGTVTAKVGIRVSSVGETINLIINKSGLTSAV